MVSGCTNVLLNLLTALVALEFLELLGFSRQQSTAGMLALICATTHLHYAQNMQENNYIFLLTLTGLWLQLRWAEQESCAAVAGCECAGIESADTDYDSAGCDGRSPLFCC